MNISNTQDLFKKEIDKTTISQLIKNFINNSFLNFLIFISVFSTSRYKYKKCGIIFEKDYKDLNYIHVYNCNEYLRKKQMTFNQLQWPIIRKIESNYLYKNKLTIPEIASLLKVNTRTVYRYIQK